MNRVAQVTFALLLVGFSESKVIENIFSGTWDGVSISMATDRCLLQNKLDAYYNSHVIFNNGDNDFKLYLPERSVFPGVVASDQHPVFLDFSRVTSFDLQRNLQNHPDNCVSASRMEATWTIPLLAREPSGPPLYSLGIGVLYERGRDDFPIGDVLFPYIPVDEITMDEFGVVVRNGSEEMKATFIKYDDPCEPPPTILNDEIKNFIENDLVFGLPEPDVSICDRHRPLNKRFCSFVDRLGDEFHLNAHNICETWNDTGHEICKMSVDISNMSSGFRDLLLLRNDGPINVIASETYVGNFTVGLKYPCIE